MILVKKWTYPFFLFAIFAGCRNVELFEKNVAVPGHAWSSSFKPQLTFTVSDTASLYNIYVVLRHSNAYAYKNAWVTIGIQPPGGKMQTDRFELPLATDEKGWLGSGMDDIFEHRIPLYRQIPLKKGTYTFQLENAMREDPLPHIFNVGIRVEKANL